MTSYSHWWRLEMLSHLKNESFWCTQKIELKNWVGRKNSLAKKVKNVFSWWIWQTVSSSFILKCYKSPSLVTDNHWWRQPWMLSQDSPTTTTNTSTDPDQDQRWRHTGSIHNTTDVTQLGTMDLLSRVGWRKETVI